MVGLGLGLGVAVGEGASDAVDVADGSAVVDGVGVGAAEHVRGADELAVDPALDDCADGDEAGEDGADEDDEDDGAGEDDDGADEDDDGADEDEDEDDVGPGEDVAVVGFGVGCAVAFGLAVGLADACCAVA